MYCGSLTLQRGNNLNSRPRYHLASADGVSISA